MAGVVGWPRWWGLETMKWRNGKGVGDDGGGWKDEKRGDGRRSRVAGWLTLRLPPLGSRHAGPKTNLNLFY